MEKQAFVRNVGIFIAILLRIGLLFLLVNLIKYFQNSLFIVDLFGFMDGDFNIHSLIVLFGRILIMYTAIKEIWHMVYMEEHAEKESKPKSVAQAITMIVLMNLIFSLTPY